MAEGSKSTAAVVNLRVGEVLRIVLDGSQFHDVVQYAAENGWGLKERQLRNYVRRADALLVERQKDTRRKRFARHLARREALYARCVNAADYRTALAVLCDLAKLQGLYPPPAVAKPQMPAHEPLVIVVHGDDKAANAGDAAPPSGGNAHAASDSL